MALNGSCVVSYYTERAAAIAKARAARGHGRGRSKHKGDGGYEDDNDGSSNSAVAGGRSKGPNTGLFAVDDSYERWGPSGKGGAARRRSFVDDAAEWAQSVGLLPDMPQVELTDTVVRRLTFMSKYGFLVSDLLGPVGMTKDREERVLQRQLVRRKILANMAGHALCAVCALLLGMIGPYMSPQAQVSCSDIVQILSSYIVDGYM